MSSGRLRKRPINEANKSFHTLQQDDRFHQSKKDTNASKQDCEHLSKPLNQTTLRGLLPPQPMTSPLVTSVSNANGYSHVNSLNSGFEYLAAQIQKWNDHARQKSAHYEYIVNKTKKCLCQIQKWNDNARQKSALYEYIFNKSKRCLCLCLHLGRSFLFELISIRCTFKQKLLVLFTIAMSISSYVYFVKIPIWSYEEEWTRWELGMQKGVANLIPPLQLDSHSTHQNNYWHLNSQQLEQFPYLRQKFSSASQYVVPIPDYELMGRTRGELAQALRGHAIQSCEKYKHNQHNLNQTHSLPVIGITVANDTPDNRYLRRLLHTIDLITVGSIVITWYDEQTEAQLVGKERAGLSHEVTKQALQEFIARRGFHKIAWDGEFADNMRNLDSLSSVIGDRHDSVDEERTGGIPFSHHAHLADISSLRLLSRIATSVQQFCRFDENGNKDYERNKSINNMSSSKSICRNELLILRFATNLGCSTGVNNPLFTHPTAPHWLIANYDIAYPPGVLNAMGEELQKVKMQKPDLAVHTYGYIYGRGKLANPWSNFVMTSCAVANVGIWDENIFPAYYEDDDYRDRIRYIMGKWMDIGDPDRHTDAPQYLMDDTHLIHYQTDRYVSVAHGPLIADTYLSGTAETMKKVDDDEQMGFFKTLQRKPHPFHYESQRWNVIGTVSNTKKFFQCKHGALPDAGENGDDPVRYFGRYERFRIPFVNRTRVSRLRKSMSQLDKTGVKSSLGSHDVTSKPAPWALWYFNATRRKCIHTAANLLLSMPPSEERTKLTEQFGDSCSVC